MQQNHHHTHDDIYDHLMSERPGAALDLYAGLDEDGAVHVGVTGYYTAHLVWRGVTTYTTLTSVVAHAGGLVDYAGPAVVEVTPIGRTERGLELTVRYTSANQTASLQTAAHLARALELMKASGGYDPGELWLHTRRRNGGALRVAASAGVVDMHLFDRAALLLSRRSRLRAFEFENLDLAAQLWRAVRGRDNDRNGGLSA